MRDLDALKSQASAILDKAMKELSTILSPTDVLVMLVEFEKDQDQDPGWGSIALSMQGPVDSVKGALQYALAEVVRTTTSPLRRIGHS